MDSPKVREALAALERLSDRKTLEGYARYGIRVTRGFGVPMGSIQKLAKRLGRSHELAEGLWASGWYEARLLAAYVDEPERVTAAQMDRWCADFDNWGVCDTICFALFDRTKHAFGKVPKWARRRDEFGRRAGFALLACLALHDKEAGDDAFLRSLPLVEEGARDERNFVKKGVSWALRLIGRRNLALHGAALEVARRLAASKEPAARWVGNDAVKELTRPDVLRRLEARGESAARKVRPSPPPRRSPPKRSARGA